MIRFGATCVVAWSMGCWDLNYCSTYRGKHDTGRRCERGMRSSVESSTSTKSYECSSLVVGSMIAMMNLGSQSRESAGTAEQKKAGKKHLKLCMQKNSVDLQNQTERLWILEQYGGQTFISFSGDQLEHSHNWGEMELSKLNRSCQRETSFFSLGVHNHWIGTAHIRRNSCWKMWSKAEP